MQAQSQLLLPTARLCVRRRDGFGALEEHDGLRPGRAHRLLDALHQSEHGHRRQPRHQRRDPVHGKLASTAFPYSGGGSGDEYNFLFHRVIVFYINTVSKGITYYLLQSHF